MCTYDAIHTFYLKNKVANVIKVNKASLMSDWTKQLVGVPGFAHFFLNSNGKFIYAA